jgi:hypothetical protein
MIDRCPCSYDDACDRIFWLAWPSKRIKPFVDFEKLSDTSKKSFKKSFEYWASGFPYARRHHGWDSQELKHCYVFKDGMHRLYGFLCRSAHGVPHDVCVICIYAKKKRRNTDPAILLRLNRYREDPTIANAVVTLKEQREML